MKKQKRKEKEMKSTLLRMRPNSLDLNSFRADFWRRSMRSSPLRSTTSSLISSVVLVLISFISSNRFDIITTDDDGEKETLWGGTRMCFWILTPLNEDLGIGMWGFGEKMMVEGEAIERLNIFCLLLSWPVVLLRSSDFTTQV